MEPTKRDHTTHNAVKLVGEAFMPGASLLLDGKIAEGGAHLLLGAAAKALLGPVGLAIVIANSYAKSTTGKNLIKQFTSDNGNGNGHSSSSISTSSSGSGGRTEHKVEHTKTTTSSGT